MLTPKDIRNASRISGYEHVGYNSSETYPAAKAYQAYDAKRPADSTLKHRWKGPRRFYAQQAAQDYCDYVNAGNVAPPKPPKVPTPPKPTLNLQRAHHPRRASVTEGPKTTAHRVRRSKVPMDGNRLGFVYLIGIMSHAEYVKVGWSSRAGFPRLNELQTGNPLLLVGEAEIPGTLQDEYNLHAAHEVDNVLNEWFLATPDLLSEFDLTWFDHCCLVHDNGAIEAGAA